MSVEQVKRNLEIASLKWKDKWSYSRLMRKYDLGYTTIYDICRSYKGYFISEKKEDK